MAKKPEAAEPRSLPKHVKLLADWGEHKEGKVLRADADLIAQLDTEGVRYRVATATERSLAGLTEE